MAIYLHLQTHTMGPKEVGRITDAYERALRVLWVKDRDDPLVHAVEEGRLVNWRLSRVAHCST